MQIVLDVKPSYYQQIMGVLQSLDPRFFNKIETDTTSLFAQNQKYLAQELADMESKNATMISEEAFWASTDEVLATSK
ncbi:MAG: hypothetical protein KU37_06350 [Sulfuricurvum sp. PC08-66]|nr:MAG: hypothetical protein KU37_06350 [Sulfuricurvum sp. PC08-66]